jgi:hypothetical protein
VLAGVPRCCQFFSVERVALGMGAQEERRGTVPEVPPEPLLWHPRRVDYSSPRRVERPHDETLTADSLCPAYRFRHFHDCRFGWLFRAVARSHRHGLRWLGSLPGLAAYLILIRQSGGINEKGANERGNCVLAARRSRCGVGYMAIHQHDHRLRRLKIPVRRMSSGTVVHRANLDASQCCCRAC